MKGDQHNSACHAKRLCRCSLESEVPVPSSHITWRQSHFGYKAQSRVNQALDTDRRFFFVTSVSVLRFPHFSIFYLPRVSPTQNVVYRNCIISHERPQDQRSSYSWTLADTIHKRNSQNILPVESFVTGIKMEKHTFYHFSETKNVWLLFQEVVIYIYVEPLAPAINNESSDRNPF